VEASLVITPGFTSDRDDVRCATVAVSILVSCREECASKQAEGDEVVIRGLGRLRDGSAVNILGAGDATAKSADGDS
jgi:hypothetical protein